MKYIQSVALLAMIIFCYTQNGSCQKNTLKITPIKDIWGKFNFSYERKIAPRFSILADVQLWFLNRRESIFGPDENPVLETNEGTRFSVELRTYKTLLSLKSNKINFYLGLGGFGGSHDISYLRERYAYMVGGNSSIERVVPQIEGGTRLFSAGIHLNTGLQFALGETLKFEFGIILGKAWINQANDYLTLSSYDYYLLEEDRPKYNQDYSKKIAGLYVEPMFVMGFSF